MTNDLDNAKYYATLVLQCTSLAELFLKDYQTAIFMAGFGTKQSAKMRVNQNKVAAEKLRLSLKQIEIDLTGRCSESQQDAFLEDVGYLHQLVTKSYAIAGDSELRRNRVLRLIDKLYPIKKLQI